MEEESRNVPDRLRDWAEQVGLLPGGQDDCGVYRKADAAATASLLVAVTVAALVFTWAPDTLPFPFAVLGAILAAAYLYERCPGWSLWVRLVGVAIVFLGLGYVPTIGLAAATAFGVGFYLFRRPPRARSGLVCLGEWDDGDKLRTPFMVSAAHMTSLIEQIEWYVTELAEVDPGTPVTVTVTVDDDGGNERCVRLAEFAAGIDTDDELPLTLELAVEGAEDGFGQVV
ncbi:MAG: hypothetical protein ACREX8_17760, partial [Gammaproteobacteria bacterium]